MIAKPFLILESDRPGKSVQYFASRAEAVAFAAANPNRVSLNLFGILSGTKDGRPYSGLVVFTPAALRRERAEIAKDERDRAARAAARERALASGKVVLPSEIVPTELGL